MSKHNDEILHALQDELNVWVDEAIREQHEFDNGEWLNELWRREQEEQLNVYTNFVAEEEQVLFGDASFRNTQLSTDLPLGAKTRDGRLPAGS